MVSPTKQTARRRAIRKRSGGQRDKLQRARQGTPAFPIQPEGYDPAAPDARPARKTD